MTNQTISTDTPEVMLRKTVGAVWPRRKRVAAFVLDMGTGRIVRSLTRDELVMIEWAHRNVGDVVRATEAN
jgi:hypothetical protein